MEPVSLQSVTKVFGRRPGPFNWFGKQHGSATRALSGVSLEVKAGEVLAVLGPNGSGKSTLFRLIATMLLPDEGNILVGEADVVKDAQAVRQKVGFAVASERSFFPRLTARENLKFFSTLEEVPVALRSQRIDEVLTLTELEQDGDRLVQTFSSGMYQRLGISRALLKRPSVLLLDEPTRSLDPGSAAHIWQWVREFGYKRPTVLIATHNFEEAIAVADSVAILRKGDLVARRALTAEVGVDALKSFYFEQQHAEIAPQFDWNESAT